MDENELKKLEEEIKTLEAMKANSLKEIELKKKKRQLEKEIVNMKPSNVKTINNALIGLGNVILDTGKVLTSQQARDTFDKWTMDQDSKEYKEKFGKKPSKGAKK